MKSMHSFKKLLILSALFITGITAAQSNLDSLENVRASGQDTSRVDAMIRLADHYSDEDPDKALKYLDEAYPIAQRIPDKDYLARLTGERGNIYYYLADYEKAIRNFLEMLKAYEDLKDPKGIANCLNNIGSVYSEQHDYKKALEYHFKALAIREENEEKGLTDKNDIGMSYSNIGQCYQYSGDFTKAMDFYNRSLRLAESIGNKKRVGLMLNNIGSIYAEQKFYDNALVYFTRALGIQRQLNNLNLVPMSVNNIAQVYQMKKDYRNALDWFTQGLNSSKEIGDLDDLKTSYEGLHDCYFEMKDFPKAHEYLSLFHEIKDSIFNKENATQINELLAKFDTRKKEQEIELLQKDGEMHRLQRSALIAGCVLIFIVALLLYNRNKVKQKANVILFEQKKLIETKNAELGLKNKEITDSIRYAKHLQMAILPPAAQVKRLLPDSFILYKPKDIVSGDFYWVEEWGSQVLVAAADCTGHGVPGAFMSIVGNNLLQQAVFNYGLSKPFLILNNVNKNISGMLHQSEETSAVKDGMDIALLSIDRSKGLVEFAGAFNPLWLVRNKTLREIKADKHPVGVFLGEEMKQFTHQEFAIEKGDVLYLFTDGYADQFGGDKGKKFKYKQLQQLLLEISDKPMDEQRSLLDQTIEHWKGNLEQIDDILIIGIRL
jgi:serine phosphatase RsbU (regulator of sigma subunit)/Tfp pilus assembly protein PilF